MNGSERSADVFTPCIHLSLPIHISKVYITPVAIAALEPYERTPHSARPGATIAWNDVVCTMTWTLWLTTAKAESAHNTEHARLREVTMLCKNAYSFPPAVSASREIRSTCRPGTAPQYPRGVISKVGKTLRTTFHSQRRSSGSINRLGSNEYKVVCG